MKVNKCEDIMKKIFDRRTLVTVFGMILVYSLAVNADASVKTMAMNILLGMTSAIVIGNVTEAIKKKVENAGQS